MDMEEEGIARMKRLLPSAKLIAILRNPTSRAYRYEANLD
jgi:hypothetical protein